MYGLIGITLLEPLFKGLCHMTVYYLLLPFFSGDSPAFSVEVLGEGESFPFVFLSFVLITVPFVLLLVPHILFNCTLSLISSFELLASGNVELTDTQAGSEN